jgi:ketosteroid isomerase-like protein
MKGIRLSVLGVATLALLAFVPAVSAQATDPLSVLQRYYDARNRGDLAGALSVVAPDATYTTGPCAPVCAGVDDIQKRELEPSMANGGQYTMVSVDVSGTTVTFQIEVRNNITRLAGIDRFLNAITADIRDGKIVTYQAVSLPDDPQTVRM